MEGGLGSTRMGSRSSTRHGPASVFQGRVRRWKKSWAPVAPSSTPSAAACRVLLYKWSPITVPAANGTKESTPEEPPPAKPLRYLPVSVILQQKKEEAQKAEEEAETLSRLEQEAVAATSPAQEKDGAEAAGTQQDTSMGDSQPEQAGDPITKVDEGANATEAGEQEVQDVTEANQAEQEQDESTAQEPEATSMDVTQG
ncbi:uncharacterized protein [Physcomitrium patens]|uniref:Uncharacterized protein n=1 Tax=Physcomitrium patens TaxID=3218 RepID=A0A2K1JKR8_PHYPA|nr:uncharacterized protein LOC112290693 [Physcomitrium patens]XP_024393051.1 uncharacterized protein LOC112290693 [Physcomitrium patens]PNR42131.1 hypothetical protein PHYPA_016960 [Physcomitrium patens]|eukprot:XP_024393050.1 uncharacterized protein LOC112290693 [Physcomitrella patens]